MNSKEYHVNKLVTKFVSFCMNIRDSLLLKYLFFFYVVHYQCCLFYILIVLGMLLQYCGHANKAIYYYYLLLLLLLLRRRRRLLLLLHQCNFHYSLYAAVPRNEVKVQLKACNFYPSPEGGSFVVNISWNKPTFNYSSLTAYQLYYQVGSQQRLGSTTVSIFVKPLELKQSTLSYYSRK